MSLKPFTLFLKGILMGFSMVLPGLSGGTMAFILGIYEKLIQEIACFKNSYIKSFLMCFSFQPVKVKKHFLILKKAWDWAFLIPLLIGALFSLVLFVVFAGDWISAHSLIFYSFIFGLILGGLIPPFQQIKKDFQAFALFFVSFVLNAFLFAYGKEFLSFSGEMNVFMFIPVGFLIAMALIVPGISGSYLLLIFGLYEKTLLALKQLNALVIAFFALGVFLGFIATAKWIQKMLKRYWNQSLAVILGLMAGSLYAVYPLNDENLERGMFSNPLFWSRDQIEFVVFAFLGCFFAFSLGWRQKTFQNFD